MHYTKANGGALDGAVSVISINGSLEYQVGRDASSSEAGIAKLYDTVPTTGGATDGAVTQQAVVNAITNIKTNIEDNELVVASALNDLDSRINSTVIDASRISGTINNVSTNKVYINGSIISGGYIGSNNETTVWANCISGPLGSSQRVDFGSSCNFSGLRYSSIPAYAVAYGYPTSNLSGSIPGTKISGSFVSDVKLYNATLGVDLAATGSLQYIDYNYNQYLNTTTVLSNMLKDINDLKGKGLYKILIDGVEANIQSATVTNLENVVSIEQEEGSNVWQITATGPFTVDLVAYLPSDVYNMEFHFMDTNMHYQDKEYTQDTCSTDIMVDGLHGYVALDFKTLYKDLWIRII